MTTMIAEVYDAFISAGADEEKSRSAAQAVADHQSDISELKHSVSELRSELKSSVSEIKSELSLVRWMLTIILTLFVPLLWKIFSL